MSHKMLRPFIVKVSVLGYFPLFTLRRLIKNTLRIRDTYMNYFTRHGHNE